MVTTTQGRHPRTHGPAGRSSRDAAQPATVSAGTCNPGVTVIDVDRIVIDPAIMAGVPCIAGTRIPVTTILGLLWEGASPAEVLGYYPQLVMKDLDACVHYAVRTGKEPGLDQRTPPPHDE